MDPTPSPHRNAQRARPQLRAVSAPDPSDVALRDAELRSVLADEHVPAVLALLRLDPEGRIASADGLYGRFGVNDRRLLRLIALTGGREADATQATDSAGGHR